MKEVQKKLIKIALWTALAILIVLSIWRHPADWSEYFDFAGYAVTGGSLFAVLYEKCLWRIKLLHLLGIESTPVLAKHYIGTLRYTYDGMVGEKQMDIQVRQSLSTIHVDTTTDINISQTVCASLVKERGVFALYYTYVTNPQIAGHQDNPIQYGTCRLLIPNLGTESIRGTYWTTRATYGDITWAQEQH